MLNAVLPGHPKLQMLSSLPNGEKQSICIFVSISGFPSYPDLKPQYMNSVPSDVTTDFKEGQQAAATK